MRPGVLVYAYNPGRLKQDNSEFEANWGYKASF